MATLLQNIDNQLVYDDLKDSFSAWSTENFLLQFNSSEASAALNVNAEQLQGLFDQKGTGGAFTTWINIWLPNSQGAILEWIGKRYGLSSRLLAIMQSKHIIMHDRQSPGDQQGQGFMQEKTGAVFPKSSIGDIESNLSTTNSTRSFSKGMNQDSHYRIADKIWHYSSVDWGEKYHCIGYNSLYNLEAEIPNAAKDNHSPAGSKQKQQKTEDSRLGSRPPGKRVWTWLILCGDGTVVSIFENPFPGSSILNMQQQYELQAIRRNADNVFRHLSKAIDVERKEDSMSKISIRTSTSDDIESKPGEASDQPSLLYYYLFDDWRTTYRLVSQGDEQYGPRLAELRRNMFEKPSVELVKDLHKVGQQLAVLKRIYEAYAVIIDRLLEKQALSGTENYIRDSKLGVRLHPAAAVRFERLRDRIRLLAISEIQSCLDEKDSLVFFNFNLITLKESAAVERLTRITILLAKVTILFLPVSLMTAYFSTQIKSLEATLTVKHYWIAFGVIFAASLVFLLVFGRISDTVEGKLIFTSFTKLFIEKSQIGKAFSRKRRSSR